ncbi:MAG TPA: UDP-N-acetylglucosamine 2-epimerase (non-hydrolyzing) [Sedimentisphaerales bacterium]|nr:UDP-N-acetylglucosamine 2-epimerase (non-hydrolyzing) [Sedimentisphaerales bacterium]
MKVLIVFGTRPEAIKMAPIIEVMARRPEVFDLRICATAQHREMLDNVLPLFDIQPDYDLDLMRENQTLAELTADILGAIDPVICQQEPDWVLVQGDTTTAMAAALAGYYRHVAIGHVEAGLRTYDKLQPFPEEVNRRTTGILADIHFAPTEQAQANLLREGVDKRRILVTGNTVIDALLQVVGREYDFTTGPLAQIPFDKRILLVTAHRRENFGEPLQALCRAIEMISRRHSEDIHVVYPVHLNPQVRNPVHGSLAGLSNVTLLEPLDYASFVHLMNRSYMVLTDSGGLQEEAPSLGKPVLVLRNKTERPEAVQAGTARLVGTKTERIVAETESLLNDSTLYEQMANAANPYGDGHAAERICSALVMTTDEKSGLRTEESPSLPGDKLSRAVSDLHAIVDS